MKSAAIVSEVRLRPGSARVSRAGLRVPRKRTSLWGAQAASLIMPVRLGPSAASRNELFCFRSPWTINDGSPVEETLNRR